MLGLHVSVLMVLSVAPIVAAPPPASPTSMHDAQAALKLVKGHYRRGEEAFKAEEFASALQEFTASLDAIPPGEQYDAYRARALWYLVQTRQLLDRSTEPGSRCAAEGELQILLTLGTLPQDLEAARPSMAELQGRLATECHPEPAQQPAESPESSVLVPPSSEPGEKVKVQPAEPRLEPPTRNLGRPLVISGGVLTGVGLAGLAGMATGLYFGDKATGDLRESMPEDRREIDDAGRQANNSAIALGILGGVATVTGIALLAVGHRRAKTRSVAVSPYFAPGTAALSLRLRF